MQTQTIILILIGLVVLAALAFLLFGRRQRVSLSDRSPNDGRRTFERGAAGRAAALDATTPAGSMAAGEMTPPPSGLIESGLVEAGPVEEAEAPLENAPGADALRDPAPLAANASSALPLTAIKGLGPRAAQQLAARGVDSIARLAALSPDEAARIDSGLGALSGRLSRDRWVEQARLLAAGDTAAFEAEFGKLG